MKFEYLIRNIFEMVTLQNSSCGKIPYDNLIMRKLYDNIPMTSASCASFTNDHFGSKVLVHKLMCIFYAFRYMITDLCTFHVHDKILIFLFQTLGCIVRKMKEVNFWSMTQIQSKISNEFVGNSIWGSLSTELKNSRKSYLPIVGTLSPQLQNAEYQIISLDKQSTTLLNQLKSMLV